MRQALPLPLAALIMMAVLALSRPPYWSQVAADVLRLHQSVIGLVRSAAVQWSVSHYKSICILPRQPRQLDRLNRALGIDGTQVVCTCRVVI